MTSSEDIRTNAEALRGDAAIWDQVASDMDGPIQAIAGLTLNGANDVTGLGQRLGIDDSYEKARSEMEAQPPTPRASSPRRANWRATDERGG